MRICFAKGQCSAFPEPAEEFIDRKGGQGADQKGGQGTDQKIGQGTGQEDGRQVAYNARESTGALEILTEKLTVRVDKRTGAIAFLTAQGKELLSERAREPRQISGEQCWIFFDWGKKESLIARGLEGTDQPFLEIGSTARYISFGKEQSQMPGLASLKGYELLFPAAQKVLCCNIPMYGPYVSVEGADIIDYYFRLSS